MTRSILGFLVLFFSMSAFADGPYGSADYSRRDCYTHDKLKACWEIDPGTTGDHFQGTGSFEGWTGGVPDGWVDGSIGTGAIAQETTQIYDGSSSLNVVGGGLINYSVVHYTMDLEAGKTYQISFWSLGDGADTVDVSVSNAGNTEFYNFTTDAWGAAFTYSSTTTSTSWAKGTANIIVGPADKSSYKVSIGCIDGDVIIDGVEIAELKSKITSKPGNYELTVANGLDHPAYGNKDTLYKSQNSTGPTQNRGAYFDGSNDYLYRANDGTFNPNGDFSVACSVIPHSVTSSDSIISKHDTAGNERAWDLQNNGGALLVYVSSDGTATDAFAVNNSLVNGNRSDLVFSYHQASTSYAYVDFLSNNKSLSELEINDSTSSVNVASRYGGNAAANVTVEKCCYWDKALSGTEAVKFISPYYPGVRYHGLDGTYSTDCTNTTSHATCSTDRCRDGTAGKCEAEWNSYASFEQYSGLIENNSFETYTGDPSVANFTNWTETEYAGDGTASITAYLAESVHGDASARCIKTGSTSYCSWHSDCQTVGVGSDMYGYIKAKGTATLTDLYIAQYSGVACTGYLSALTFKANQPLTDVWTWYGGSVAAASWDGSTQSYYVFFRDRSAQASESFFDLVDVKVASYRTPPVHVPASGGAVTYTDRSLEVHNPLADYVQEEDGYAWENGFCWSAWVYNDWSATDSSRHHFVRTSATAGANNIWWVRRENSNRLEVYIYDSAGDYKAKYLATTAINWTAGDWKFVEICTDNTGIVAGHHYNVNNSTWYDWNSSTGSGTGIQDGAGDLYIGSDPGNSDHFDGYIANWAIVPYNAVWPKHGFNDGRPPKDPY